MKIRAYCTAQSLPALSLPHQTLGRSDNALGVELDEIMDGLFGDGSEMDSGRYALIRHVQRVAHQVSLEFEEASYSEVTNWLGAALAVARWPDGSLRDPEGRILYHPGQPADEDAALPVSPQARARKASNERRMLAEGVAVPAHLPTVVDEHQLMLRAPSEVAERALALFLVALRAESVGAGDPIPISEMQERQPVGWQALSPAESDFMFDPSPSAQTVTEMSWRYEALQLLMWALNLSELPPPTEICDVGQLIGGLLEADEKSMVSNAHLRYPPVVLDTLDLHYRYHWATRQADMTGEEIPGGLDPGVVLERHHALNWLTRFEEAPWDDVDTPT